MTGIILNSLIILVTKLKSPYKGELKENIDYTVELLHHPIIKVYLDCEDYKPKMNVKSEILIPHQQLMVNIIIYIYIFNNIYREKITLLLNSLQLKKIFL